MKEQRSGAENRERPSDTKELVSKMPDQVQWERNRTNEDFFLNSDENCFAIYQIDTGGKGRAYHFMGIDTMMKHHLMIDRADYKMVYCDALKEGDTLESLYGKFNMAEQDGSCECGMYVSDVVALLREGAVKTYYVDSFSFLELRGFIKQKEREAVGRKMEKTGSRQSVLNALRMRQARLKEQERKIGQNVSRHKTEALGQGI